MFNFVICGNPKDRNGFSIDIYFRVHYLMQDVTTDVIGSVDKSVTINTNDKEHLDYNANLPVNMPIYMLAWQGDEHELNVLRRARKRYRYVGGPLLISDMMLDEFGYIDTNISATPMVGTYIIDPVVATNRTLEMVTYYIYYDANAIVENVVSGNDWELIKVIDKPDDTNLNLTIFRDGRYKIVCEALIGNYEVSLPSEVILDVEDTPNASSRYIEWE